MAHHAVKRPEIVSAGEADVYYKSRALAYHTNTRQIQEELTDVAFWEYQRLQTRDVRLDPPRSETTSGLFHHASSDSVRVHNRRFLTSVAPVILDLGCGSGLSTAHFEKALAKSSSTKLSTCTSTGSRPGAANLLTTQGNIFQRGFFVGCDLSQEMLAAGASTSEKRPRPERVQCNFKHALPFRSGVFDFVLSISAMQWILNEDDRVQQYQHGDENFRRSFRFFSELLRISPRGVLQFYPARGRPDLLHAYTDGLRHVNVAVTARGLSCAVGRRSPGIIDQKIVVHYPHKESKKKFYLVYDSSPSEIFPNRIPARNLPVHGSTSPSWCALCWPHCEARCCLAEEIQLSPDDSSVLCRAVREHEQVFKGYVRNMVKLVGLLVQQLASENAEFDSSGKKPSENRPGFADADHFTQETPGINSSHESSREGSIQKPKRRRRVRSGTRTTPSESNFHAREKNDNIDNVAHDPDSNGPACIVKRIYAELGIVGLAVGWNIYRELCRRRQSDSSVRESPEVLGHLERIVQTPELCRDESRTIVRDTSTDGTCSQKHMTYARNNAPSLPSAQELLAEVTFAEKLRLLHTAPPPLLHTDDSNGMEDLRSTPRQRVDLSKQGLNYFKELILFTGRGTCSEEIVPGVRAAVTS